jgi:hypothetical protein
LRARGRGQQRLWRQDRSAGGARAGQELAT